MKKYLAVTALGLLLAATSTSPAFAANKVSELATTKGGQSVAECAQKMNKGISECLPELNLVDP